MQDGAVSEQALAADTDYVIKAGWDGTAYTVTANGEEFIRVVSAAVQYSTTAAQLCFGFDSGNNAWTGTIDLHNSLITVGGKAYWKAYTVYSEILPGALDGDTGALADWNCFCDAEAETTAFDTAAAADGKVWIGHKVIESHVTNPWPIVHFSVEGSVTFRGDTAAFADGMWLVADKTRPVTEFFFGDVEFIAKITPKTPSGYNTVFRNAETNAFFGLYGAAWCIYDGSRKTGGTATAGTTYWVRAQMIYDAEKGAYASTLYVLEDNGCLYGWIRCRRLRHGHRRCRRRRTCSKAESLFGFPMTAHRRSTATWIWRRRFCGRKLPAARAAGRTIGNRWRSNGR